MAEFGAGWHDPCDDRRPAVMLEVIVGMSLWIRCYCFQTAMNSGGVSMPSWLQHTPPVNVQH